MKLSQEFTRTKNRILGALSRLDDLQMKPLFQGHSETAPETSQNAFVTNQRTKEDVSQSDRNPEASIFRNQTTQKSGPKDGHDILTGVHEEFTFHEKFTYCSPSTSSGKQKKNHSTSQPQFRSEITPATIEADQIFSAFQHLANNNNSANFHYKINGISELPLPLTTTKPAFDGKSEQFELFQDLYQTSLKIHNQLTKDGRNNKFHSLVKGDALQTFRNFNGPTRKSLGESLAVFEGNT